MKDKDLNKIYNNGLGYCRMDNNGLCYCRMEVTVHVTE